MDGAALRGGRARRPGRPRVLICNVFFPPQTIGGATRVVRGNVDDMLAQDADLDLYVLATDEGVDAPGRLRYDGYRGVPVFRVGCEMREGMDWFAFDERLEALYERIVDVVDPDLVHVHCVQRLTATIVEVVRRRAIPYVITLHDAWWISDHQFLIDDRGVYQPPTRDLFTARPPRFASIADSIARKRRLTLLLDGARHLLAVSEPFAEIYRRYGCRNVIVSENGVPDMPPPERADRPETGRVSLGHIGGRSPHKGATLVEAVLRTENFDNLHLTMVDGTQQSGTVYETVWGNTPVRLCAPLPQSEVGALYRSLDVLLAPSTWPESYGLVTREALAAGLWVVASDLGAIGTDVEDGVNGFRVDVSSSAGLRAILRRIDQDVARFTASPPAIRQDARTIADQSRELLELYGRLLRAEASEAEAPPDDGSTASS